MSAKKKNPESKSDHNHYYGLVFAVFTAMIFITLCWYAYIYFVDQNTREGVVYIKADRSPFKVIPEDPGGMVVEYKDKKVFDKITGDSENLTEELKILENEEPLGKAHIMQIVEKTDLEKEEYEQAARTILEPILKRAKQDEIENEDLSGDSPTTFEDLVEQIESSNQPEEQKNIEQVELPKEEVRDVALERIVAEDTNSLKEAFENMKGEVSGTEKKKEKREVFSPTIEVASNLNR